MRPCLTAEADVGMRYYLTDVDGTGGRLKAEPEDFFVTEIQSPPLEAVGGKYTISTITARNWETNRLIRVMSRILGISREAIGFAGTKDKRAVTSQLMSFKCRPERLSKLDLVDFSISGVYTANRPIAIGDLVGNEFRITVKDMDSTNPRESIDSVGAIITKEGGFPNYFGVQRFGSTRPITHKIGELIVRGDYEGAVMLYLGDPSEFETEEVSEARSVLASSKGDFSEIGELPKTMGFEKTLMDHVKANPDDWSGAINQLPGNLQMMFVHAYQSLLFNKIISKRMELGLSLTQPEIGDTVIPLDANGSPSHEEPIEVTERNVDLVLRQIKLGRAHVAAVLYGSESKIANGEMGEIESSIIEAENIRPEDFIIPELPRCSSKGSYREIFSPVRDLNWRAGGGSYEVSFSLPKGNYATCLMREFMKSDMHLY